MWIYSVLKIVFWGRYYYYPLTCLQMRRWSTERLEICPGQMASKEQSQDLDLKPSRYPLPYSSLSLWSHPQNGRRGDMSYESSISWVQFSHSGVSGSATAWTAARQNSLSVTNSRSLLKLMSIDKSQQCHLTISSSVVPFSSRLQSFPASGSYPVNQFFASGGQSIGVSASASVLPMNIQDWFPLGSTGLISLQTKELSRVFSNTTVQKHQFFGTPLSLESNSHIHTWLMQKP